MSTHLGVWAPGRERRQTSHSGKYRYRGVVRFEINFPMEFAVNRYRTGWRLLR
jgi:hypothetical protein